ncbi:Gfo/Idh/MocA family protein [Zavarzinia sp. CC-PAN008]|uniref:Gfo/Idh/MocA family protein n=1 Tax=Zavarzinia sp. CC-PAN008 TaxID=3243332 RepID=UPI003F7451B3
MPKVADHASATPQPAMTPLRWGLIGCGAIGSALDEGRRGRALSHAGAIAGNPLVRLVAICDRDPARLAACGAARGVAARFTDWRALLDHGPLDGISLATHPDLRLPVIEAAMARGIGRIWCEKPLAPTLAEAEAIAALAEAHGTRLALNYLRRFSPLARRMADLVGGGQLGPWRSATLRYGKGVANNASHALDLILSWFGAPQRVQLLGRVDDGRLDDPTLDARLDWADGASLMLLGTDHRAFTLYELDLIFEHGRVRLADGGDVFELWRAAPHPLYAGYTGLALAESRPHMVAGAFEAALTQLVEGAPPACSARDGVAVMALVERLRAAA